MARHAAACLVLLGLLVIAAPTYAQDEVEAAAAFGGLRCPRCASGEICNRATGQCDCKAPFQTCANGVCTRVTGLLANDNNNCGACGKACPAGQSCRNGQCVCPAFYTLCGATCVRLTDANNCGKCGVKCGAGSTCSLGRSCKCTARNAQLCLEAGTSTYVCPDFSKDAKHCGTCNNKCAAGQTCVNGKCVAPACPTGQTRCPTIGGVCTNTKTDAKNCGTCGTTCDASASCTDGQCKCPADQDFCGGKTCLVSRFLVACEAAAVFETNCLIALSQDLSCFMMWFCCRMSVVFLANEL